MAFGLHGALKKIGVGDVLAAFAATPRVRVVDAGLLLVLSLGIMAAYDVPGIMFAHKNEDFPRLRPHRVGLASFCAYALSHVLGAPALTAAAIRLRLYAQWNVPRAGIGRIIALSASNFTLGLASLLGCLLLINPLAVPIVGHAALTMRVVGGALLCVPVAYIWAARGRDGVKIFGRVIALPGGRLACAQILLSCADIATSSAILYAILPATPGLSYPHVLSIYLAGFAAGLFSGLPAGVGVFDSVLLLGFSAYLPPADALGAILLFRVMYFLTPACLAGLCYAGHELWVHTKAPGETS